MLYCFKKGKHATEKVCVEDGAGAGTDGTCETWFVKFHVEISRWTTLHGQVDQLNLRVIKSRH